MSQKNTQRVCAMSCFPQLLDLVMGNGRKLYFNDFGFFLQVTSSLNTSNLVFGFLQQLGASGPAAFGKNGFWKIYRLPPLPPSS